MNDPAKTEQHRRQKARNWAVFTILMVFVAIVFAVTILKMGMRPS